MEDPYNYEPESMSDTGWVYVDAMDIQRQVNRITLPDGLFQSGILSDDGGVYWAHEKVTGISIVSNKELEGSEYHTVSDGKIFDGRVCTVPSAFFPPREDASTNEIAKKVDEHAYIYPNQRHHFVYEIGMDEGEKRSCYLLTDDELMSRISSPEDWVGNFESIPQFF